MEQSLIKLPVSIYEYMTNLFQDNEGQFSTYQDTRLDCRDGAIYSSRLLLSLAFPSLCSSLASLPESIEPVIILPEHSAEELRRAINTFLSENVSEGLESCLFQENLNQSEVNVFDSKINDFNDKHIIDIRNETKVKCEENEPKEALHDPNNRLKCNFCEETFITDTEKAEHEKSYKDEKGQLKCRFEDCENTFLAKRRSLVRHMKEVHYTNQIHSYSCYFCGENFTGKTLFRKHMKLYKDDPTTLF